MDVNLPIYVEELKMRLHILHQEDDENLKNLIMMAHEAVMGYTDPFPLSFMPGRNLVYEYVRMTYQGTTEFFYPAFEQQLASLNFRIKNNPLEVV